MNCQEYRGLIEDSLDTSIHGELQLNIRRHLEHCASCRDYFRKRKAEHAALFMGINAACDGLCLPEGFADRLVASIRARRQVRRSWHMFGIPKWMLVAASIAVIAGFVFAATVAAGLFPGKSETDGATAAEVSPGIVPVADALPIAATAGQDQDLDRNAIYPKTNEGTTMRKGIRATLAAIAAALTANAAYLKADVNTSIPWTSGSGVQIDGISLADGKVHVYCDASGNVTNLVAKPGAGETLTITGDAMTFAAGAKITFAAPSEGGVAGGRLVFANDVTAVGALGMDRTDDAFLSWTGANTILKGTSNYDVNALPGKASVIDDYIFYSAFADPPSGSPFPRGTYQLTDIAPNNGAYAMNLWKNGYTWSLRLQVAKAGNVDVHLRLATIVRQPFGVYEPKTDVWDTYFFYPNGLLDDAWWWFMSEKSGNTRHIRGGVYKGQAGNGSTGYSGIKHVVWRRKDASVATVGFAGDVILNGTVDVALGVKMSVLPKSGSTFAAPVFTGGGDVEYHRNATLAKANYLEYSSYLTITNGAVVTVTTNNSIPTNGIVNVYANSTLSINTTANDLCGGYPELCIHQDGKMFIEKTSAQHTFNGGKQCVVVDGGMVWIAHDKTYAAGGTWKDSRTFMPYVTLLNGAQIKGSYANIGNNQSIQWMVVGESQTPVTVDAFGALGWTGQVLKFSVADITGDDAADLVVGGEMPAFESGGHVNYRHYTIQKEGNGTMRINGQWALRGATTVNGGGIVFGDNGGPFPVGAITQLRTSEEGSRSFVLKDGAKLGKTAGTLELDALTVTNGGVLELGPTATMAFADSSAKTWSGGLVIKGFRDGAVRFGNNVTALTATQQSMIKTEDGKSLHLLSTGYLAPYGTRIVIR